MIFQQSLPFFDTRRSTCDALQYPEHVTFPSVAPYCRWQQWNKIFSLPRDQVKPFFRAFGFAHNFFFEPKPIKARPKLGLSSQANITSCEIPPSRDGRTCTHYKECSAQFVKALGTNTFQGWNITFLLFLSYLILLLFLLSAVQKRLLCNSRSCGTNMFDYNYDYQEVSLWTWQAE